MKDKFKNLMLVLRSFLFNSAFFIVTIIEMLLFMPVYFVLPRRYAWFVPKFWARTSVFLLQHIAGLKIELEGLENLAKIKTLGQSYIIAPKHQSAIETFAILPYLDDPSYILKRELMFIPLFGWYMAKTGIIAINRGSPIKALKKVLLDAHKKIAEKRQILIFPEGTRRPPGAEACYKPGIFMLYKELNVAVLPIAHNAGLYWPRNSFYRYSGVLKIKILPPIEAGLAKDRFFEKLIDNIETSTNEDLLEIARSPKAPPLTLRAIECLKTHASIQNF